MCCIMFKLRNGAIGGTGATDRHIGPQCFMSVSPNRQKSFDPAMRARPIARHPPFTALLLLGLLSIAASQPSATPTPTQSVYGVCGGRNVPYQINTRPQFITQVTSDPAGVTTSIEVRLCVGVGTAGANVGVTALKLEASLDGEQGFAGLFRAFHSIAARISETMYFEMMRFMTSMPDIDYGATEMLVVDVCGC